MLDFKKEFIDFSLKKKALNFGNFILKSGRKSPYFFNTSSFYTGNDIKKLAYFYYCAIIKYKVKFNHLFGLAYKGIPIVVAISLFLKKRNQLDVSFSFNRKEKKLYGERGNIIGNENTNKKSILIDDVITSGISIKNSINQLKKNNILAAIVAFDRKELSINKTHSKKEIRNQFSFPIFSIITIKDLIQFIIEEKKMLIYLDELIKYNILCGTEKINL
ncbi:Orotate phosphoribosyltransferase [Buchnera aphidicola (Tetraneura ulmi)]|uniref:orotate phosphoribosyltransferase n=1 Tax=Buchnera aphidicola TaxID=9 RepID=UPI0034638798